MALLKKLKTHPKSNQNSNKNSVKAELKSVNHNISNFNTSENILSQVSSSQNQAKKVMSDLSRLSKDFADSFQDIEGRVEALSGQLDHARVESLTMENEKQKLQFENAKINNRLNNLLEILPSGVVLIDQKGLVCECNEVAIEILGRPLLGEMWLSVIARAFSPKADDGHQVSLKDGRKIHIETKAVSPEPGQLIVLTDMTKTRELQDELSQKQKLSSMGKMIASLAHQIRTPLSAAMIYGSHIKDSKLDSDKQTEFSESLMERLRFMDRQIHDMLQFVRGERKQKNKFSLVGLSETLEKNLEVFKSVKLKGNLVDRNSTDFNEKINQSSLIGSKDDLIGAVTNLVNNALAATKNLAETKTAGQKNDLVTVLLNIIKNTSKNDTNVYTLEIEVKDNGHGISAEDKLKIFEPFYSTKNKGNGLGLSIVRGVVIEHGGKISVESNLGKGTKFKISLPVQVEKSTQRAAADFNEYEEIQEVEQNV